MNDESQKNARVTIVKLLVPQNAYMSVPWIDQDDEVHAEVICVALDLRK